MGDEVFDCETRVVEQHLEILWQYVNGWATPQREFLGQVLEHLSNALEELRVTREELHQQNEELIAAKQTLEAERQRYRELFEFAPDGYLVTNASGVIQEANHAAAALFSMSRYFLLGKPLTVFVLEDDRESFGVQLNRLKKLKRVQDLELRLKPPKGPPFHASITVAAARNPQKKLVGLRWSIRDITERKEVETALMESERQYRVLFENIPSGMYRTTPDGRILMVNPALIRMLGYRSFEELASRNLEKEGFAAPYLRAQFRELLEREDEIRGLESAWVRCDNSIIFIRENAKAVRGEDGTVLYYEGSVEDITERKRAEEVLLNIAKAVSAATGETFFRSLVEHLAKVLEADYVFIGELMKDKVERVRTIAVFADGKMVDNFEYDLAGTPCENVVGKSLCSYSCGVQEQFPRDYLLAEMGVKAYVGTPLFDSSGRAFGLMVVLYRQPVSNVKVAESMLQIYATRSSAELERQRAEQVLRENLAQLAKKNRYEAIVSTVTRSVHQSINLQDVLENAVDAMSKNIDGVNNVSIYMVEGQEAIIKAYRGYPEWWIKRVRSIPYPKGFTWRTIIIGDPIYCADVDRDTIIGPAGREMGTKSYISMPIHFGGKGVGAININSLQKNAFEEEELKLLEIVAQQIEIAINNAQQAELLYRANEELELRVGERTQRLSETNEELKKEIAWRKQAEKALRNSEEQYRTLYENNPSMYFTVDKKGRILSLNQFGAEQLGYMAEELIGQSALDVFHEDDRSAVLEHLSACLQSPTKVTHWELRKVRKDRSVLWVRESARAIRRSDGSMVVLIVCDDITERRRAEEQLKGSLKEKEMLLKELHHRVKNNLQVVSSLLDLQADYLKDRQAVEIISKSRNRIRSMGLVHERLYQSKNMAKVDFAEYIRELTDNLFYSYGVNSERVKLKIDAEDVLLNINSAIPCGLIINELVSNSLKYAFPKGQKGEIRISLRSKNGGGDLAGSPGFTLIVGNNGVGFPKNLNFRTTESLGLQLVMALVEQIGGAIELDRTNGVKFKITFTELERKENISALIE
jgi:PAS domain S-box-containing protein